MSQNIAILALPVKLAEGIKKHRFVTVKGEAAGEDAPIGIAMTDGGAGDVVTAEVLGTAKLEAGGAIPLGGLVSAGPGGKGISPAGEGRGFAARALEAAGADGDVIEVLLLPGFTKAELEMMST